MGGIVTDCGGDEGGGKGLTVLGQKRSNPYTVDNIRLAYKSLYEVNLTSLSANHLYVRFLPQDPEDVGQLLSTGLAFTDYPLDYDIVTMGDYYHDPSVANPDYTWEYAVVPYNFTFPAVQYEILEQLALVPEDSRIAEKAFQLTGNAFDTPDAYEANPSLVNNRFNFTPDHGGGVAQPADPGVPCQCPLPDNVRKPSGCVTVFDNMLDRWEAVRGVEVRTAKVRLFSYAFYRTAVTSVKGCWEINHKYHGSIHVWVKFDSPNCDIKVMDGPGDLWGYTWAYGSYMGKFGGPNFNNINVAFNWTNAINTKGFRDWAAATTNNTVYDFQNYAVGNGLPNSPGNLKILITPWGNENSGAAPMLDKSYLSSAILASNTLELVFGVFGVLNATAAVPVAALTVWITVAAPDVVLNLNEPGNVNADDVREILYHELAHAQHFAQAGTQYWHANIEYIISHLGYGDGTAPGAGRCSVIEMWGWQNGPRATHGRYGLSHSNGGLDPAFTTWEADIEDDTFVWGFMPIGWQHDLLDNNATNPTGVEETDGLPDAVTGFTQAQIFATMNSNLTSPNQQRLSLQSVLPPGATLPNYLALANAYGL